jgi:hypothetical protein
MRQMNFFFRLGSLDELERGFKNIIANQCQGWQGVVKFILEFLVRQCITDKTDHAEFPVRAMDGIRNA